MLLPVEKKERVVVYPGARAKGVRAALQGAGDTAIGAGSCPA